MTNTNQKNNLDGLLRELRFEVNCYFKNNNVNNLKNLNNVIYQYTKIKYPKLFEKEKDYLKPPHGYTKRSDGDCTPVAYLNIKYDFPHTLANLLIGKDEDETREHIGMFIGWIENFLKYNIKDDNNV